MPDDSHRAHSSAVITADESGLTAVLAHSMLGTVAAIRGAIDAAMEYEESGTGRDSLLLIAVRRLEFLTSQLRDLAAGVPGSSVVVDLRVFSQDAGGDTGSQ
jgi:hypothetical protein